MKAVILNGAREGDAKVNLTAEVAAFVLSSHEVEVFNLRQIPIAHCLGCFGCWIRTPDQCVINDAARDIAKKLEFADLKVFVTPIVFGGYSYQLKKMLDRQICGILPFFTKINGEIHHGARYEQNANVVGLGVLPKPDEESEKIFQTLLSRNAINMHAPAHSAKIVYYTDDASAIEQKTRETFAEVGAK
jgi:multimeric flavodoxin WrbA